VKSGKWRPFLYFIFGQIGWFGSVLSAASGRSWIGVSLSALLIMIHLLRVPGSAEELKLIVSTMVLGGLWESALTDLGWLVYPGSARFPGLAPYWIIALWALFAAQFNTTYGWLTKRPAIAVVLGAVAGPLSFHAGARLGALRFAMPWPATVAIAFGWGGLLPCVVFMARRWNGVETRQ